MIFMARGRYEMWLTSTFDAKMSSLILDASGAPHAGITTLNATNSAWSDWRKRIALYSMSRPRVSVVSQIALVKMEARD